MTDTRLRGKIIMKIVCVGSTMSGKGKTSIVEVLLGHLEGFCALKVTTVRDNELCPRSDGCGTCSEALKRYILLDDPLDTLVEGKDTWRYSQAGAAYVQWLKSAPEFLGEGLNAAFKRLSSCGGVIVEGNMPMHYLESHLNIIIIDPDDEIKDSALSVLPRAHLILCESEKIEKLKGFPLAPAAHVIRYSPGNEEDKNGLVSRVSSILGI
jgi:molybdopterin-guanine dinucleotide biosynthesis protein